MSQGNACAAIGLANTSKIPMIGGYLQGTAPTSPVIAPQPGADGPYIGLISQGWTAGPINELDWSASGGFTVPATSGATAGKVGRIVSNSGGALTVSADQTCSVSAAGVAAAGSAQAYRTYIPVGTVIPINSFFWVYLV